jgi:hypothetical protein
MRSTGALGALTVTRQIRPEAAVGRREPEGPKRRRISPQPSPADLVASGHFSKHIKGADRDCVGTCSNRPSFAHQRACRKGFSSNRCVVTVIADRGSDHASWSGSRLGKAHKARNFSSKGARSAPDAQQLWMALGQRRASRRAVGAR